MYKDSYCYAERVRRMTDGIHNIAVIDLGSNSLRMSVNAVMPDGKWKILLKLRETVRLGEGMTDGCLRAESVERVVRALEQYRLAAASAGCDEMIATATQAVRIAKNRRDFLDAAKARADIDFRILTGEEEARYSFLAVKETICPAFTRMEVFFDSFCARVAMMVSRSSPSSSFMVHMPSSVKYTSMPIRFKSLVCWRVSTVFLANLDTSLVTIKSKCPSFASSIIRTKFLRLAMEVPVIPSSIYRR